MMGWYSCVYPARPDWKHLNLAPETIVGDYSSYVWANSMQHARKLARQRNIGEKIIGFWGKKGYPYIRPSILLRRTKLDKKKSLECIHSVCFLCYFLQRSIEAKPQDILGDEGILHMTIHSLQLGWPSRRKLASVLEHFEDRVPGFTRGRK